VAVVIDGRRLISTEEAAQIVGITINNLRQKVHLKMIHPVTRQGRRVYFDELDAIALRDTGSFRKAARIPGESHE